MLHLSSSSSTFLTLCITFILFPIYLPLAVPSPLFLFPIYLLTCV
uniref:Uncharacterized protein n=1 Tax=Anguilla anguilla TaxID=7936 RepID=A0A0E9RLG8_ANGAN